MKLRLRARLQGLADRVHLPTPGPVGPVYIHLTADTRLDADTRLEWDGSYVGRLCFGGIVLEGSAEELARFACEAGIAAEVAVAAQILDAGRFGTLSPSGGEA
ncbi:hypothetical protein AB0J01_27680 [Streptomyces sp. NPDC050204]|uniref:hypothetical protein n=1 Tax=Streptomyces sp. NPDC050204 TaxID=3155514 RepID=UPI00341DA661